MSDAPPQPALLGRALFFCGALSLPVGVGIAIGFWIADQGAPWLVTLRALVALLCAGLLTMALGSWRMGPAIGRPVGRTRLLVCTLLLLLAAVAWLTVRELEKPSPLTRLSRAELQRTFARDAESYKELESSLARVTSLLSAHPSLFPPTGGGPVPSADEERLLEEAWETYFHAAFALDEVRRFHEDYYRFDPSRSARPLHVQSFLLTFACELAVYEHTFRLTELVARNSNVQKLLQEARPERGIPAGSYSLVSEELAGVTDLSRVKAGKPYLAGLRMADGVEEEIAARGQAWLVRAIERHLRAIEVRSGKDLALGTVGADFEPWKHEIKAAVYPYQSMGAEWVGDTRFRRPVGSYLITHEQLATLAPTLQPGDVMLGRKNWYLSNVGLPGFWPHALLWVGDDPQLRAAFDQDGEVRAWVRAQCGEELPFTDWLARTYPEAWADRASHVRHGDALVVIEAVSEGVVQSTFAHAAGDYLAVLRPQLAPLVKARAIARAFAWLGRPYDFEFDFATDTTLVCSEVVWRAYRPQDGLPGLEMPLVNVLGRETLPPHDVARLYAAEKKGARQQFAFVAFLEGREKDLRAVVSDEAAFLRTPERSKWDFRQE